MVLSTLRKEQSISKKIIAFILFIVLVAVVTTGFYLLYKSYRSELNDEHQADAVNKFNIHFIPHTHDDVGWLKTVDQYYYGRNESIQSACVQCIIDNVIEALEKNPDRKFIYVETAYLWKWWQDRNETQRNILKNLVHQGRLEIIGGGWSMNDEAVTHYQCIIDQLTWGFRRLNEMFGSEVRPRIGWQIDPFGHSREQASIFAQMGFDGLFFARLDYQDRFKRLYDKTAEFVWKGSSSLGESSNLFSSVLFNYYSAPTGFCFDIHCNGSEHINDENVERRVSELLKLVEEQAESYKTTNVLLTMGDDFHYSDAESWFKNMDKLIEYINENKGPDFKAFYSTPSIYLDYLHKENLTWSEKDDDFLPYTSDFTSAWTGYYSSRPTLKFFERLGNNFLQVLKQLSVITKQVDTEGLNLFREAMGVMQHHDAITGTKKQHVAEDYEKMLYESFKNGGKIAEEALNKLTRKVISAKPVKFHSCFLLNISSCQYSSDNEKFVVTVYNPTSQPLTTYVRLPVQNSSYKVQDFTDKESTTQLLPIPKQVLEIPGRSSTATHELVFKAETVPPLGFISFYVTQEKNEKLKIDGHILDENETIEGEFYKISVNSSQKKISIQYSETDIEFDQSFYYYESMDAHRASGAYIFRPRPDILKNLTSDDPLTIYNGTLVDEIHQKINDWVSQVIRIYKDSDYVEFDWLVGPIPTEDKVGKEIITKFSSNLKNKDEFFTDSNGRQMMLRKLNYRPTWEVVLPEPIAGNYYPVTTKISIEDKLNNLRLSVLTDRAQGGSSLKSGEIELMVHRRLLNDDGFGVGEALTENAYDKGLVARGQHYVIAGSSKNKNALILREKELAIKLASKPWIFITPTQKSFKNWTKLYRMKSKRFIKKIPKNVRVLTLEPWNEDQILLRLEHFFEKNETSKYSSPIKLNLKELFSNHKIVNITETSLGGNVDKKKMERLQWNTKINQNSKHEVPTDDSSFNISLDPMEIKTFIIKFVRYESLNFFISW